MKRRVRALLGIVASFAGGAHCSLLVQQDLSELACAEEGVIGAPACENNEICAVGRCRVCSAQEICADGVDNDCNGRVDDRCEPAGDTGAGGEAGAPARASGGVTGAGGGDAAGP